MRSRDRREQALAALLAVLAGFVDGCGFLASGSFFVSFMSGNSTRVGIGLAQRSESGLAAAGIIAAFLAGVIVGALLGQLARERRRASLMALVALLLASAAASSAAGAHGPAIALMAAAMGAENNVFARNGEVSLGVTYMTGSLVKLGQRIAAALTGEDRFGWLPHLVLWASFVVGVVVGASAYPRFGLSALWAAAAMAAALALATSSPP